MKINVLPSEVYNQISAGEVVENPRSVVKELAENSIDAGATSVSIYIEDGGIKSVTVIDDGIGIEKGEVEKAFLPHATSKILSADDIGTLSTLGFRGEALASIAAVAEVTMTTRFAGDNEASKITVKGGIITEKTTAQIEKGTNIEVRSLFFNTPARFKFLKAQKSEENAVTQAVCGLILSNPDVEIKYYVDGQLKLSSDGTSFWGAVEAVLPSDFATASTKISLAEDGIKVGGYISLPSLSRGNRLMQFLIINGRVVSDSTVSSVVQNAYQERLMSRTFPLFVIDLVMPFDLVDVNVHPNKLEVRLANPRLVHSLIFRAIKHALEDADTARSAAISSTFAPTYAPTKSNDTTAVERPTQPFASNFSNIAAADLFENKKDGILKFKCPSAPMEPPTIHELLQPKPKTFGEQSTLVSTTEMNLMSYRVVGQIFSTYILIENGDEILLIDQHAAHERILYNKFVDGLNDKSRAATQSLLVPYIYAPLSGSDFENVSRRLSWLIELGFDVAVDDDRFRLSAVPCAFTGLNFDRLFDDLCDELRTESPTAKEILKQKIAKAACRAAIKGGDELSEEEISFFVDYYIKEGAPLQCPHGRPTVIKVNKKDIEKMFKRIV